MGDHRLFAAVYDRATAAAERAGLAERRRRLLGDARGRTLEIGGGTGANLRHYTAGVDDLVVLEPDGAMRERLLTKLGEAAVPVEVHEAGIDDAPFPAASFDTVVSTLTLCTVPDLDRAVAAISRLLRSEGRLLFLEHVRATGVQGWAQQLTAPLWTRVAAGCHPDRDVLGALRRAGFVVSACDHFTIPRMVNPLIGSAVQGAAQVSEAAA
jgi:SAM-dependent methyltransferase